MLSWLGFADSTASRTSRKLSSQSAELLDDAGSFAEPTATVVAEVSLLFGLAAVAVCARSLRGAFELAVVGFGSTFGRTFPASQSAFGESRTLFVFVPRCACHGRGWRAVQAARLAMVAKTDFAVAGMCFGER